MSTDAANKKLTEALKIALNELEGFTCIECGEEWGVCKCPNGKWWLEAKKLVQEKPKKKK